MAEISKRDLKVERQVWDRSDAINFFKDQGEHYKAQIIESIPGDEDVSLYSQGNFTDLCRGPHVPSTSRLKVFKLMKLAGAYWRGDSHNEMLQRIYGTAWVRKEDQDAYLHRLEEAEKRDHRKLAGSWLYFLSGRSAGDGVRHPKGWVIGRWDGTCRKYSEIMVILKYARRRF
jgi:threonyl-tRNA synthetase